MPLIRDALRAADPSVVQVVERVDDELARGLDGPRFLLALMAIFAAAALALSAAGVYAVLSCLVAQQMREMAVRLMLGARPLAIGRRIVGGGLGPVVIGITVGVCVMATVARVLGSLLFEVQTHDAWSYAIVAMVLVLAAIGAAWRPALRAMNADPLSLLRSE